MKREPRLQFTDEERADPKLKESLSRAEKAAVKADEAQAKVPKKKVVTKVREFDLATGKAKTQLRFEEVDKKAPSKLTHTVKGAPAAAVRSRIHREVQDGEDDNVGVEAAHKLEETAEAGGRLIHSAHHAQKLKTHRAAAAAERKLEKANIEFLQEKAQSESPTSNPVSRWQQKRAIRKQYAAAKAGKPTASAGYYSSETTKAAKKATEESHKAVRFVRRNKKGFLIAVALFLLLSFFLNGLSSCSVLAQGAGSVIAVSTYPSQDEDMLDAEAAYCVKERELQSYLDNFRQTHNYDEYHFDLDEIQHDPYVLISILSALHPGGWTVPEVENTLQMLFDKQYILTEELEEETRTRTETEIKERPMIDPITGKEILDKYGNPIMEEYEEEVEVEYTYYICTVTLENFDLSHVPVYIMGEKQLGLYAVYMATLGNRPDLFPNSEYIGKYTGGGFTDYDIPPEAMADETFAAIITEAEKYLGYPYVWGGSSPSTSFDCSGFVSWVLNHSGWNLGRLSAQGLCNICARTNNPKPGDLVFFTGTYDTPGISHVGIYVGNSMMIHCGDPISYSNLNSTYWQSHLYGYGRLP